MANWGFYGRTEPLSELQRLLQAERWFFCRIEGRRRIGKTTLLSEIAQRQGSQSAALRLIYMQVPDSDERDVCYTFRQALLTSDDALAQALASRVINFSAMADAIGQLCRAGFIVVLDEFQYFTRSKLYPFNSFLQAEVDKLRRAKVSRGGLFILGSLQSDMNALLDDRGAPLYGRVTARVQIDHWTFEDLLTLYAEQSLTDPSSWLTLWTFFEGVPKFYHDTFEQDLYTVRADDFSAELLKRMFLRGSSPLSEEADTWFLRELRGKSVAILHYLADHPGCSHAEIVAALKDEDEANALGAHLSRLVERYGMIDRLHPVFSDSKSRNARYYLSDNFLQAWLSVAKPARESARLRPLDKVLGYALPRLETLEGVAFEKWIRQLHVEASRQGRGDFELTELKMGYWNRPRDISKAIEIDLVALDDNNRRVRFGCCKRAQSAHDLKIFEDHVNAFLKTKGHQHLQAWDREMVVFSPVFSQRMKAYYESRGYLARDLLDYAKLFMGSSDLRRPL